MRAAVHVAAIAGLLVMAMAPLASSYPWPTCNGSSNYTANSAFQENLRILNATLPSNVSTSPGLFATATVGAAPDTVYALAFCPPVDNQNASGCRACVAGGFQDAPRLCPSNRAVYILYNFCVFTFSGVNFLGSATNPADQEAQLYNALNLTIPDVGAFNRATYELLNATADYAASSAYAAGSRVATGEISFDATYPRIYSMAWCTPDMAPARCRACLAAAIAEMPAVFIPNTQGARISGVRCTVRFEVYPFYKGSGMVQLTADVPGNPGPGEFFLFSLGLGSVYFSLRLLSQISISWITISRHSLLLLFGFEKLICPIYIISRLSFFIFKLL